MHAAFTHRSKLRCISTDTDRSSVYEFGCKSIVQREETEKQASNERPRWRTCVVSISDSNTAMDMKVCCGDASGKKGL